MKTIKAFILGLSLIVGTAKAQVAVQITVAPPAIPVYTQPPCPVDGYMWSPGYWAYGPDGYYWVPGVWVASPTIGYLWTPGYWDFVGGFYAWHRGYWGPHIGYYGGINYGFGYGGHGFYGGRWENGHFNYNTNVWHVNNNVIHNTYHESPAVRAGASHASFNGAGGVTASPSANERVAMKENHVQATSVQQAHQQAMSRDKGQLASANGGKPSTMAMSSSHGSRFNGSGTRLASPARSHSTSTVSHGTGSSHTAAMNHSATMNHSTTMNHNATMNHSSTVNHTSHTNTTMQHQQRAGGGAMHAQRPAGGGQHYSGGGQRGGGGHASGGGHGGGGHR